MRVQAHTLIQASAENCFDLSQDYSLRPLWDSLTPHAQLNGPAQQAAAGTVAHCPAPLGLGLNMGFDVVFIQHQRPHVVAFRLLRGPWLFRSLAGSWRFDTQGDAHSAQACRVSFTYHLRLHPVLHGLLSPLVGRFVQRHSRQRLNALKRLAEARHFHPNA